jgi:hypothetical protein
MKYTRVGLQIPSNMYKKSNLFLQNPWSSEHELDLYNIKLPLSSYLMI